jgi:hypothetical protein
MLARIGGAVQKARRRKGFKFLILNFKFLIPANPPPYMCVLPFRVGGWRPAIGPSLPGLNHDAHSPSDIRNSKFKI